jgi:hypothetical protein
MDEVIQFLETYATKEEAALHAAWSDPDLARVKETLRELNLMFDDGLDAGIVRSETTVLADYAHRLSTVRTRQVYVVKEYDGGKLYWAYLSSPELPPDEVRGYFTSFFMRHTQYGLLVVARYNLDRDAILQGKVSWVYRGGEKINWRTLRKPTAVRQIVAPTDKAFLADYHSHGEMNATAAVRDALVGGAGFGSLPGDQAPLDGVVRAFESLVGERAEELSRGVAACLADDDAGVRAQALLFFERFPAAAGAEALTMVRHDLYTGVANPFMPGNDLEWQLLRSIGARALLRDPAALALARDAALDGRAQPLIAALAAADPAWVVAHAVEIVRNSPDAAAALLINLQGKADVGAIGEAVAPLAGREFRGAIDTFIEDEAVKRRILSKVR